MSENGSVSKPFDLVFVLMALFLIAACSASTTERLLTPERIADTASCQVQANAQGLELLSPERNAFIGSCLAFAETRRQIEKAAQKALERSTRVATQ